MQSARCTSVHEACVRLRARVCVYVCVCVCVCVCSCVHALARIRQNQSWLECFKGISILIIPLHTTMCIANNADARGHLGSIACCFVCMCMHDSTINVHSMKMIDSLCAHQDPRCPGHRSGRRRSEQPPWEAMEAHSPHHRSVFFPPWLTIMNATRTASPAAPHSETNVVCMSTFYEYFTI